jgi:putative hydrolase of the HAD superfamily
LVFPNGLKFVFFDLDGTLRHSRPTFNQALIEFSDQAGLPVWEENRRQALRWLHRYWAQSSELLADLETFNERRDLFWTNHARLHLIASGCPSDQAADLSSALFYYLENNYHPEDWVPVEVPECLGQLLERGFRLAVVSNRNQSYYEQLASLGLDSYFEFALAAGEVNSWKPDSQIFLHALDRIGAQANQTLYVGDNYYADIVGARSAGLEALLLDPEEIFSDLDCATIHSLAELPGFLEQ